MKDILDAVRSAHRLLMFTWLALIIFALGSADTVRYDRALPYVDAVQYFGPGGRISGTAAEIRTRLRSLELILRQEIARTGPASDSIDTRVRFSYGSDSANEHVPFRVEDALEVFYSASKGSIVLEIDTAVFRKAVAKPWKAILPDSNRFA